MITKRQIGKELKELLNYPNYHSKVANWACALFSMRIKLELAKEVYNTLYSLAFMEEGPEFEYSKQELKYLAHLLIMEEENPFDKMLNARPIMPTVYTRERLGQELKKQLAKTTPYDPATIAYWAEGLLLVLQTKFLPGVYRYSRSPFLDGPGP